MSEIEIIRNPAMIAGEINLIKKQTQARVLEGAIEIGRRLQEAKGMVGHGAWADWLRENVDYSQSTADNLMRIAAEYGDEQIGLFSGVSKSETFANLSYSQACALFSLPEPERAEFVETHDMDAMSARDVQDEIKKIKAEKAAADAAREEAEHRAAELEGAAKRTDADIADAISQAVKAKTEKEDAEKKYRDAKKALDEASEKEKKLKDALAAAQKDAAEARARMEDLRSAEPVQPELSAEREAEIRAEVSAEYQRKLEAAADVHVQKLQFAMNEWIEIFNRKIIPELAEINEEKRGKIAEAVKAQAKQMAERLGK